VPQSGLKLYNIYQWKYIAILIFGTFFFKRQKVTSPYAQLFGKNVLQRQSEQLTFEPFFY